MFFSAALGCKRKLDRFPVRLADDRSLTERAGIPFYLFGDITFLLVL
jgi:hypothetical protein